MSNGQDPLLDAAQRAAERSRRAPVDSTDAAAQRALLIRQAWQEADRRGAARALGIDVGIDNGDTPMPTGEPGGGSLFPRSQEASRVRAEHGLDMMRPLNRRDFLFGLPPPPPGERDPFAQDPMETILDPIMGGVVPAGKALAGGLAFGPAGAAMTLAPDLLRGVRGEPPRVPGSLEEFAGELAPAAVEAGLGLLGMTGGAKVADALGLRFASPLVGGTRAFMSSLGRGTVAAAAGGAAAGYGGGATLGLISGEPAGEAFLKEGPRGAAIGGGTAALLGAGIPLGLRGMARGGATLVRPFLARGEARLAEAYRATETQIAPRGLTTEQIGKARNLFQTMRAPQWIYGEALADLNARQAITGPGSFSEDLVHVADKAIGKMGIARALPPIVDPEKASPALRRLLPLPDETADAQAGTVEKLSGWVKGKLFRAANEFGVARPASQQWMRNLLAEEAGKTAYYAMKARQVDQMAGALTEPEAKEAGRLLAGMVPTEHGALPDLQQAVKEGRISPDQRQAAIEVWARGTPAPPEAVSSPDGPTVPWKTGKEWPQLAEPDLIAAVRASPVLSDRAQATVIAIHSIRRDVEREIEEAGLAGVEGIGLYRKRMWSAKELAKYSGEGDSLEFPAPRPIEGRPGIFQGREVPIAEIDQLRGGAWWVKHGETTERFTNPDAARVRLAELKARGTDGSLRSPITWAEATGGSFEKLGKLIDSAGAPEALSIMEAGNALAKHHLITGVARNPYLVWDASPQLPQDRFIDPDGVYSLWSIHAEGEKPLGYGRPAELTRRVADATEREALGGTPALRYELRAGPAAVRAAEGPEAALQATPGQAVRAAVPEGEPIRFSQPPRGTRPPPGFERLEEGPQYGPLAGKWVYSGIADHVRDLDRASSSFWAKWMSAWGEGHLAWNPGTGFRNMINDVQLNDHPSVGLSPWNPKALDIADRAVKLVQDKPELYQLLVKHGLLGGEMGETVLAKWRETIANGRQEGSLMAGLMGTLRKEGGWPRQVYTSEDQIFEAMGVLHRIDQGDSPLEAIARVKEAFPDYRIIGTRLPGTPLKYGQFPTNPFIRWDVEMVRSFKNAFRQREDDFPGAGLVKGSMWLAKWYGAIPAAITSASLAYTGITVDQFIQAQKYRPHYRASDWLAPTVMFPDAKGRMQTVDLANGAIFADYGQRSDIRLSDLAEEEQIGLPMQLAYSAASRVFLGHPLFGAIYSFAGINPWTLKPVEQPGQDVMGARLSMAAKQVIPQPPDFPGAYNYGLLKDAADGVQRGSTRLGYNVSLSQALARIEFGLKVQSVDPELEERQFRMEMQGRFEKLMERRRGLETLHRGGRMEDAEYETRVARLKAEEDAIRQERATGRPPLFGRMLKALGVK